MTPSPLNVVALISGGKDSLFSIQHVLAQGHVVVALANLHPGSSQPAGSESNSHAVGGTTIENASAVTDEDLDSFMYQTVGHRVVPLYSQALGLPLYRRPIRGTAVNTSKSYHPDPASEADSPAGNAVQDETESLTELLLLVKQHHPAVNAVSTGAILSDYQRTRVESVALRLNLTPISLLWQYPELPPFHASGLLQDMSSAGLDARIVKTASAGLDDRHLWMNVATPRSITMLEKAMSWGDGESGRGACLGEGGEYETLAIEGLAPLWKGRIEVSEKQIVSAGGGSWIAIIKDARVVLKEDSSSQSQNDDSALRIPPLLEEQFAKVQDLLRQSQLPSYSPPLPKVNERSPRLSWILEILATSRPSTATITARPPPNAPPSLPSQTEHLLSILSTNLKSLNLTFNDALLTTITLREMSSFPVLNELYSRCFTLPNPPARVTIASGTALPPTTQLEISMLVPASPTGTTHRRALHVQSQSYWAPANIGPYSQATSYPLGPHDDDEADSPVRVVSIAGQIPLLPTSTTLLSTPSFATHAALALQHLVRIGRATGVHWFGSALAYVATAEHAAEHARAIGLAWTLLHEAPAHKVDEDEGEDEDEDADPAHAQLYGHAFRSGKISAAQRTGPRALPDWSRVVPQHRGAVPPVFTMLVAELPRAAPVEWSGVGVGVGGGHVLSVRGDGAVVEGKAGNVAARFFAVAAADEGEMRSIVEQLRPVWASVEGVECYVDQVCGKVLDEESWFMESAVVVPGFALFDAVGRRIGAMIRGWVCG